MPGMLRMIYRLVFDTMLSGSADCNPMGQAVLNANLSNSFPASDSLLLIASQPVPNLATIPLGSTYYGPLAPLAINWSAVSAAQTTLNYQSRVCDVNCCCDPDCSMGEQNATFSGCRNSNASQSQGSIEFCSSSFFRINNGYGAVAGGAADSAGALCVVFSNSPIQGFYYNNPGTIVSDADFNAQTASLEFPIALESYDIDNSYLNSTPYKGIRWFRLAALTVGINSISCVDLASGIQSNCSSATLAPPSWNAAASVCVGAVVKTNINIQYGYYTLNVSSVINNVTTFSNQSFSFVQRVSADIVIANITLAIGGRIEQSFSTTFSSVNNTASAIGRSGSPGYRWGSEILVGSLTTNSSQQAIVYNPNPIYGITLASEQYYSSTQDLQCPDSQNYLSRTQVTFGDNVVAGCTLYYSFADLNTTSSCATIRSRLFQLQTLTVAAITHVGKFGNASYLNVNDWVPILNNPPSALTGNSPVVDTLPGTCSSLLTELDVQVVYSDAGSKYEPQNTIVGVRVQYVSGRFQYRCLKVQDCLNLGQVQPFRIRNTVTFVPLSNAEPLMFVPPPPNLFPPIPDDLFYPFQLGAGQRSGMTAAGPWWIGSVALLVLYFV
ncbi:uncharacterized protein BJ171DRAFT_599138 [Polychytrium aggregatum]|uniref:uncharacterized protein n=1 Tax=Polychytrium aggregatum TaxID=110093 RepID=UPI0022FED975|nr:uncharacterized protein BJ171DRAFT_599138 [Polychytrium aggregatum]KAI9204739.1 hypothetical protein BJ171DRAFT_599138 [Polychytrium aggregatum]